MKSKEIMKLATEMVQSEGLGKISFRTLADAVGVKSSSVHYHFPTKSHLIEALLENYHENFQSELEELDQQDLTAKERILGFARIFESVLSDEKVCLCGVLAVSVKELDESSTDGLARFFTSALDWLVKVIEEAGEHPLSSLPGDKVAKLILSGLEGAVILDRVHQNQENLQAQLDFIEALFP